MRGLRMLLVMGSAVALLAALPGAASATSHTQAPAKTEEKPAAEKAAKPAAEKTRRHVGTVKAVDAAGKTLTVEEKSGEATLTVTDKTTIKRGKSTAKLDDVKAGDQVTVVYTQQDGEDVARSIVVKAQ